MSATSALRVLVGGTFNPIHFGHLRSALELAEALNAPQVHLLPCHIPPHRVQPSVPSSLRLKLIELAIADEPRLAVDARELEHERYSYSLHTLKAVREEIGAESPLIFALGMDAFLGIESWHQWQDLFQLAHFVVFTRPGAKPQHMSAHLKAFFEAHRSDDSAPLINTPCGRIWMFPVTALDISSTRIRQLIAAGNSPRYLLPGAVWDYIQMNRLYLERE
ncbi:MAG TPA: nicotinate-nucleotide adenylyltransferase [Pseudomonadales bacterium]|nr:nicotinate-nucleotide adenylyltransferase [Pseudomonadales bacterium]